MRRHGHDPRFTEAGERVQLQRPDIPPQPGGGLALDSGPLLDLWFNLGVKLESVATEVAEYNRKREKLWSSLHQVPLTGPALITAGKLIDEPNLLGPRTGWFWDIRRLSFRSPDVTVPWTGTIYVYDGPAGQLLDTFVNAAPPLGGSLVHDYTKGSRLLHPHQRLVYVAGPDFGAGAAMIGGEATQAADDCVPYYLG